MRFQDQSRNPKMEPIIRVRVKSVSSNHFQQPNIEQINFLY